MGEQAPDLRGLLEQVRAGSEEAAFQLFELYGPPIRTVVRRTLQQRLRTRFDSEDITQEVWTAFFANPPDPDALDKPDALFLFFVQMAKHKTLDAVRRQLHCAKRDRNREKSLNGSADWVAKVVPGPDPTPSACAAVNEKWAQLSPRDRHILEQLCAGKQRNEIAAELGLDLRALRKIIGKFFLGDRS